MRRSVLDKMGINAPHHDVTTESIDHQMEPGCKGIQTIRPSRKVDCPLTKVKNNEDVGRDCHFSALPEYEHGRLRPQYFTRIQCIPCSHPTVFDSNLSKEIRRRDQIQMCDSAIFRLHVSIGVPRLWTSYEKYTCREIYL